MTTNAGFNLFSLEERNYYLQEYGDIFVAFSTLQPDMEFYDMYGVGFIAFRETCLSRIHILGDPISSSDQYLQLVKRLSMKKKICSASQISGKFARMIHTYLGYKINACGYEAQLHTEEFTLQGGVMSALRHKRNICASRDVVVTRYDPRLHSSEQLEKISASWMKLKRNGSRELSFLTRPIQTPKARDTVTLVGSQGGKLLGFVTYDPIYRKQKVIGYYASILRQRPDAPNGLLDFINIEKIRMMKEAGISLFSLGWAPLAGLDQDINDGASYCTHQMLRFAYKYLNTLYAFKNLAFHKERYRPSRRTLYFAFDTSLPIINFLELYILTGILSQSNIRYGIQRIWRRLSRPQLQRASER